MQHTKIQPIKVSERQRQYTRPEMAAATIRRCTPTDREGFVVLYLDTRHRLLAKPYLVSVGTLNASMVHPREVFGPAVELRAAAIIVGHNHPSGDVRPSGDDKALHERLAECGNLLGIRLLDGLVVAHDGDAHHYSAVEEGDLS